MKKAWVRIEDIMTDNISCWKICEWNRWNKCER